MTGVASGLWAVFLCAFGGTGCRAAVRAPEEVPLSRFAFEHAAMGTQFRVVLYAESEAIGQAAAALAFERIDSIETVATDYDATSEARQLSATPHEWVPVSADRARVLWAADRFTRRSGGAFDASLGAVSRIWRRALRQGEWPSDGRWEAAWAAVGWDQHVALLDVRGQCSVRLGVEGMRLDFGGVAKGVAVDEALAVLKAEGIVHALVDGGGDLAALGPPPGRDGWRVSVRPFGPEAEGPVLRFSLAQGAIATSGDAYQSGVLKGPVPTALAQSGLDGSSRFGHIMDPRSRAPLPGPRAAVMTARSAAEADALATALTIVGPELEGSALYEGLAQGLRRGIFFGSLQSDSCVGGDFPHDGVRLLTPAPASATE